MTHPINPESSRAKPTTPSRGPSGIKGYTPKKIILDEIDYMDQLLCQCQGCGAYADISKLGEPHNCHKNEDGTYEEGGTFQ